MGFSDLLEVVRRDPQAVVIPADWAQGRASFGLRSSTKPCVRGCRSSVLCAHWR